MPRGWGRCRFWGTSQPTRNGRKIALQYTAGHILPLSVTHQEGRKNGEKHGKTRNHIEANHYRTAPNRHISNIGNIVLWIFFYLKTRGKLECILLFSVINTAVLCRQQNEREQ